MEIKLLRSFVTVAEAGGIGRAASRLHISQPPLTRQIHQLEDELGTRLLIRSAQGIELTDAGKLFLEEARNILALAEQAIERTQQAGLGKLGRIDIGIFGSGIFGVIPKILTAFRQEYPDVKIVLHNMNRFEQIAALRDRRLTVGFNRLLRETPDIDSEVILTEPLYLAINRNNKLSRMKTVPWSEIANHPLIAFPSGSRPSFIDWVHGLCQEDGFHPNVVQEVGDATNGIALAATGFGVCIVPKSATNLKIPDIVYRPLFRTPPPEVDLSCIYRIGDSSPILQSFLRIARTFRTPSFANR